MAIANLTSDVRNQQYSPSLRTALVLTGSGTAGAYHAGVLRALQEAGVKIDVVAGQGMGAVSAMFAAIDGGSRLWDKDGIWMSGVAGQFYRWRKIFSVTGWILLAAVVALVSPVMLLAFTALVYPASLVFKYAGFDFGIRLTNDYSRWLNSVFLPEALPLVLPRVVVFILLALMITLGINYLLSVVVRARRRARGALWRKMFGELLSVAEIRDCFAKELWKLIRGAASISHPFTEELSHGYVQLLSDNLGQPGFRELIITSHDIDARRDIVFALLSEAYGSHFFNPSMRQGARRIFEAWDLSGAGHGHAIDALFSAVSLPVLTEPHLITFAPDSQWRGETHRGCDRPDAVGRVLEEVLNAGVEQAIVVSSAAELTGPHALTGGRSDLRGFTGEYLASIEAASVQDAVAVQASQFQEMFLIRPEHNPLGPFDMSGAYDKRSDRRQTLNELVDQGYQDAYRQFIDPVIGASGEGLDVQV